MKNSNFLSRIEALRGVAALIVTLGHSMFIMIVPGIVNHLNEFNTWDSPVAIFGMVFSFVFNGSAAVTLFFVMSGYVLGLSLDRWQGSFLMNSLHFILQRFFRIYPALLVSLICIMMLLVSPKHYALATSWFNNLYQEPVDWYVFLRNALLAPENSDMATWLNPVTWSLKVELIASAVFPVLYLVNRNSNHRFWDLLAIIGLLMLAMLAKGSLDLSFVKYLFIFYIGLMLPRFGAEFGRVDNEAWSFLLFIISLPCLLLVRGLVINQGLVLIVEAMAAAGLVLAVVHGKDNWLFRLLDTPVLRFMGRISYSFYLLNFYVLYKTGAYLMQWGHSMNGLVFNFVVAFLSIVITLPLAFLMFEYVEKPGIRLGKSLLKSNWLVIRKQQPAGETSRNPAGH